MELKPVYVSTSVAETGRTQKEVVKMVATGERTKANIDMEIGKLAKGTINKTNE